MSRVTVTAKTLTNIDDEYSAEVELTDAELAGLQKVKAALDEARAVYDLPRLNPRPYLELS